MGEDRIAEMVFKFIDGDEEPLVWLRKLGCEVEEGEGYIRIANSFGMTIGLVRSDPITVATAFGFAVAGAYWPFVFPHLLDIVNKEWRRRKGCDGKQLALL